MTPQQALTVFNSEKIFKAEVEPLLRALQDKCKEHRLPLVAAIYTLATPTSYRLARAIEFNGFAPPRLLATWKLIENEELPPVGWVGEYGPYWHACEIVAMHEGFAVVWDRHDLEYFRTKDPAIFRPIRTTE